MRRRGELRADERAGTTTSPAATPHHDPVTTALLHLQRTAGNAAVAGLVLQRASAKDVASAKAQADQDFAAGAVGSYFAGNFLANHLEDASAGAMALAEKAGGSKAARSQAYKKLAVRSDVDSGGSGWGPQKKMTGTNTLILDFGVQKKLLMRAVNVAALDVAADPSHPYVHPKTEERLRTVTYSSGGKREEKVGQAELGAKFDTTLGRYRIDHLGQIG